MKEIVSYSELASYRDCPLKWRLSYEQRWTRDLPEDSPRSRGTLWHLVMEAHYQILRAAQEARGGRIPKSAEKIVLRACREAVTVYFHDQHTGKQSETQAIVEWMYDGYVSMHGADLGWLILGIEYEDILPLPSLNGRGLSNRYFLRVAIDLVVVDELSKVWIVDHKSCKALPSKRELEIDDQFGLYTWFARQAGFKAIGSLHSAARTQRNVGDANGTKPMLLSDRFSRTPMFRTDVELSNLALDAVRAARDSRAHRGKPVHSSPNPMECRWKCDFLDAHLAMRKGIKPSVALRDQGLYQAEFNHTERPMKDGQSPIRAR